VQIFREKIIRKTVFELFESVEAVAFFSGYMVRLLFAFDIRIENQK